MFRQCSLFYYELVNLSYLTICTLGETRGNGRNISLPRETRERETEIAHRLERERETPLSKEKRKSYSKQYTV